MDKEARSISANRHLCVCMYVCVLLDRLAPSEEWEPFVLK